jgi:signal transduction histidine kinase
MYEECISFLRRSVTPETREAKAEAEKLKKEVKDKEKEARKTDRRNKFAQANGSSPLKSTSRPRRASRADSKGTTASSQALEPPLAMKSGPRDSKIAKRDADVSEKTLYADAAKTLRRILKADAVAIVNIDEYQLFIRRATGTDFDASHRKIKDRTKESIITSFLQGKSWPTDIDPVIHYVPRSNRSGVTVLGTDSGDQACTFHFDRHGAEQTLSEFLETFLKTRHFWWDREDTQDELSQRIMDLMPGKAQTTLGAAFLSYEGKAKFAMFASWDRPPSAFGDSQTVALPFAWILGGCTAAALAVRKMRALEQSQISYSNLQAQYVWMYGCPLTFSELRTPLHQILAITQLLRSSMNDMADTPHALNTALLNASSLTTTQQIRDLLPFLDAIDTSGKTLHGIVDNILSFLDLKGKENMVSGASPSLLNSPSGVTQSLEVMFEELIHDACEEDKRSRRANGQPMCNIETVFEIIPPLLGEQVTEDAGGALRRAMSKILSNAYKFIEGEGCVEIYVDDVPDLLPPQGCEDVSSILDLLRPADCQLALSKRIKIRIVDNGKVSRHLVQGFCFAADI